MPDLTTAGESRRFAAVRILLGGYLAVQFLLLAPYAGELFGSQGMLPHAALNPTYPWFPDLLYRLDSPVFVRLFVLLLAAASLALAFGAARRPAALLVWYGWAALFHRNNLIEDPALFFIGWMLLACAVAPPGEAWRRGRGRPDWSFPAVLYWGALIILGAGYSVSGLHKLLHAPSWQSGQALELVLEGPLARDNALVDAFLGLPDVLRRLATWSVLGLELAALPLLLWRFTRRAAWIGLLGMHLGILGTVAFADLSLGMVVFHALLLVRPLGPQRRTSRFSLDVLTHGGSMTKIAKRCAGPSIPVAAWIGLLALGPAHADPDGAKIGERPTLDRRLDQEAVDRGAVGLRELIDHGRLLFDARFNRLDGQGRPASAGGGAPRIADQPAFIRTSAPDANACVGCHVQPASGGAGDFVANVFVLAQLLDPVTTTVEGSFSNERNTLGMMGAGPIEMLAREMSGQLIAIREQARAAARSSGIPQTRPLVAKGVSFGTITVLPDGRVNPSRIEGVDWDLIVKPFHQKGAVVSLREFSNNAMNHHHGMQSVERFGLDTDPDGDGVRNELLAGDITAVTVFQAALNTPGQVLPRDPGRRQAIVNGARLFQVIQCASCHVPELHLDHRDFTEPNPFNPPGNLRLKDVAAPFRFDMTREGPGPRLERTPSGGAIVRAFTDLKRHDLNDADYNHFANEQVPQGKLNGFAPASDFTIPPPARPTRQFLTRKLWDVGNTGPYGHRGDLTLITDAIEFHGGEARASRDAFFALGQERQDEVIEFLKSLQVVPDGAARFVHEETEP